MPLLDMRILEAIIFWSVSALLAYLVIGFVVIVGGQCIGGYCKRRLERLEERERKSGECCVYKIKDYKRCDDPHNTAGNTEPQ